MNLKEILIGLIIGLLIGSAVTYVVISMISGTTVKCTLGTTVLSEQMSEPTKVFLKSGGTYYTISLYKAYYSVKYVEVIDIGEINTGQVVFSSNLTWVDGSKSTVGWQIPYNYGEYEIVFYREINDIIRYRFYVTIRT